MPKVHEERGYRVYVLHPPREHGPPHVHVIRAEGEVVIDLNPVGVREVYEMPLRNIVRAVGIVEDNLEKLIAAWRSIHG
jgi:hypothetical protein